MRIRAKVTDVKIKDSKLPEYLDCKAVLSFSLTDGTRDVDDLKSLLNEEVDVFMTADEVVE